MLHVRVYVCSVTCSTHAAARLASVTRRVRMKQCVLASMTRGGMRATTLQTAGQETKEGLRIHRLCFSRFFAVFAVFAVLNLGSSFLRDASWFFVGFIGRLHVARPLADKASAAYSPPPR